MDILRCLPSEYLNYTPPIVQLLHDTWLTLSAHRYSKVSRVRTRHKISAINKGHRTSHSKDNSRPAATLPLALVAPVHMEEVFLLRVVSLAVQDRFLEAPAALVCHLTDHRRQAGSLLVRASTALPVLSLPTCLWVPLDSRTRTSRPQVLGAEHQVVRPRKRSSRLHSLMSPRLMVQLNLQSARQMRSRLEKLLRPQLLLSRLPRRPSSPSLTSQPLWHRRTPSRLSRVVRKRHQADPRVDALFRLYLSPART